MKKSSIEEDLIRVGAQFSNFVYNVAQRGKTIELSEREVNLLKELQDKWDALIAERSRSRSRSNRFGQTCASDFHDPCGGHWVGGKCVRCEALCACEKCAHVREHERLLELLLALGSIVLWPEGGKFKTETLARRRAVGLLNTFLQRTLVEPEGEPEKAEPEPCALPLLRNKPEDICNKCGWPTRNHRYYKPDRTQDRGGSGGVNLKEQ